MCILKECITLAIYVCDMICYGNRGHVLVHYQGRLLMPRACIILTPEPINYNTKIDINGLSDYLDSINVSFKVFCTIY